jgi:hypothetical protein
MTDGVDPPPPPPLQEEEDAEEKEKEEEEEEEKQSDMKKVEEHFLKYARKGVVLSAKDLKSYCKRRNLLAGVQDKELRNVRYLWKQTALHSRWVRPSHYMGSSIDKIGNIMADFGEFRKNLAPFNGNHFHLMVGVDCLSQVMACYTYPNKSRKSWEDGVRKMIANDYPYVTTFITDRDTAVTSKAFQARLKEELGIDWMHLRSRSKAYKAERGIRTIKEAMAIALSFNEKGDLNWRKHLDSFLERYNSQFVIGSTIRRKDVNKENQYELLKQLYKTEEPSLLFHTRSSSNFSKSLARKIGFRFKEGDKVLLSRSANFLKKKQNIFDKKSILGSYTNQVFTIKRRQLKSSGKKFLTLAYALRHGKEDLPNLYYQTELVPALFANRRRLAGLEAEEEEEEKEEEDDDDDEEEEEEKESEEEKQRQLQERQAERRQRTRQAPKRDKDFVYN